MPSRAARGAVGDGRAHRRARLRRALRAPRRPGAGRALGDRVRRSRGLGAGAAVALAADDGGARRGGDVGARRCDVAMRLTANPWRARGARHLVGCRVRIARRPFSSPPISGRFGQFARGLRGGARRASLAILALNRKSSFAPERVLIAGLALGALLDALVGILMASGDPRALRMLNWLAGFHLRHRRPRRDRVARPPRSGSSRSSPWCCAGSI